jgi:CBS domain-containing protein
LHGLASVIGNKEALFAREKKGTTVLKVREIMTRDLITVSPGTEILQAAKLLLQKQINGLPVVDDSGELVGIICQSDLVALQKKLPLPSLFTFLDGFIALKSMKQLEKEAQKIAATIVGHAMTPNPVTVSPETPVEEVANLMVDKNFHTLPVVDGGKLVGIVGKADLLRLLAGESGDKKH